MAEPGNQLVPIRDLKSIHGFLFREFHQGKNPQEASIALQKHLPEGIEFDEDAVIDFHERVKSGRYKFGVNMVPQPKPEEFQLEQTLTLENIFKLVPEAITRNADLKTKALFRRLTRTIKDVVDSATHPLDDVTICMDYGNLLISDTTNQINLEIEKVSRGCCIYKGETGGSVVRGEFAVVIRDTLRQVLSTPKLLIRILRLEDLFPRNADDRRLLPNPIRTISEVLALLPEDRRLKVENLSMTISTMRDLERIIRYLDSATLKLIHLENYDVEHIDARDWPDMTGFEAWMSAKRFLSPLLFTDQSFVRNFSHFCYLDIRLDQWLESEEMFELKDRILENREFRQMRIAVTHVDIVDFEKKLSVNGGARYKRREGTTYAFAYADGNNILRLEFVDGKIIITGPRYDPNEELAVEMGGAEDRRVRNEEEEEDDEFFDMPQILNERDLDDFLGPEINQLMEEARLREEAERFENFVIQGYLNRQFD